MVDQTKLKKLEINAREANLAVYAAIEKAFPKGTRIVARIGRGTEAGEVVGTSSSFRVMFRHERTGRIRKAHFSQVTPA